MKKLIYLFVVAAMLLTSCVSKQVVLDTESQQIMMITGPNMSGKSALLRQTALIVLMAQMGSFVPAKSAHIGIVDKIFTRVGASDNLAEGESTFMVEMLESANILNNISPRSLVLLDESLSSTGSYEASYIAAEVLAGFSRIGCRCLFSTHLHELAAEIDRINDESQKKGGVKIDTLGAGIEEGRRSFKIYRMQPDGKSYARDIADKYGLSFDALEKRKRGETA